MVSLGKSFKVIGRYLRQHRLRSGFTQAEVSNFLGYASPQFVSNWERGFAMPPRPILKKLVKFYSLDSEELIDLILDLHKAELRRALNVKVDS